MRNAFFVRIVRNYIFIQQIYILIYNLNKLKKKKIMYLSRKPITNMILIHTFYNFSFSKL